MKKKINQPDIHFKDVGADWKMWKIGEVLTEKYRPIVVEDEKEYQLVTVKRRNEGVVSRGYLKGKNILVKNYFEVEEGDFIISKRQVIHGATGIIPKNLHKAVVSNEYLVATSNENISTEYWTLISKLPEMYKKFFLSSYGVDIEKLVFDVRDWKKRTITIPDFLEQKKITKFFYDLEQLILFYQNKYRKFVDIKKSMVEKMFPKNGSDLPEIRFRQFQSPWLLTKFKTIANVRRGLTYSPINLSNSGVRVLRSSNIFEDCLVLREDDVFVNKLAINIELVKENDILITSANGSSKLVGKHAVVSNLKGKTVHGGFMLLATTKYPYFLNASMSTSWYTKFINLYTAGGGGSIGNINKGDLEDQDIFVPNEDEQKIIGEFFKNIDSLISEHKLHLIKLRNIKKAFFEKLTTVSPKNFA